MNRQTVRLGSIVVTKGLQTGPFGSQLKAEEYTATGVPVVMPKDISGGKIIADNIARVSEDKAKKLAKYRIISGDILFPRRGDFGRIGVATAENEGWLCGTGCLRARLKEGIDTNYISQYLRLSPVKHWLESNALGQTMLNLNTEIIADLPILLIPKEKQTAIANLLSTWDRAIELKERLIIEKRQQQKWLTQDLLAGKKRLPGFAGEWEHARLGDLFCFENGFSATRAQLQESEGVCYLHYGDIHKSKKNYIDMSDEYPFIPKLPVSLSEANDSFLIHDGDLIFVDVSEDYEGICKYVAVENKDNIPFIAGLHTIIARSLNNKIADDFKRHCFNAGDVKKQFALSAKGTSVYGITKNLIQKIAILLPPFPEQIAIAQVLSTADREIELHEKHLEELKKQKKALMHMLLTGKVRIKTQEVS